MFAILAEDRSDAEALVILVKRILDREDLKIHKKGFSGCGELRRKAASHILDFARQGASRFIICHDSDGKDPGTVRKSVRDGIGGKLDLNSYRHAIIVPVQELEAWIIADAKAITSAIRSLVIADVRQPETISSPKEWLVAQSRTGGKSRPLYAPATFNKQVAAFLDVPKVQAKCPSFRELVEFVRAS
ncbi:MAG: hypothetical protein BGO49_17105 [Planctomycetales bacterium 71-10]|nr:MAG: hypothetical protein BGO49_17105 [Planctomycetales bacterium 71-10]